MSDKETGTEITSTEYKEWLRAKVTAFIVNGLKERRQQHVDALLGGATIQKDSQVTSEFTIGYIAGISELLNIQFDDKGKKVSEYGH